MNLVTILGVVGASLILLGFVGNRLKYWQSDSLSYVVINALGSLVLIVYSTLIESYPFIALNIIWLLFSMNDIVKRGR
jgi:hypothetical protein